MRYKVAEIAPAVDAMLGDQFQRLIKPMGKVVASPAKPDEWKIDPEKLEDAQSAVKPKVVEAKPAVKVDAEKPKTEKPEVKEVEKPGKPK